MKSYSKADVRGEIGKKLFLYIYMHMLFGIVESMNQIKWIIDYEVQIV